jgi:Raf kinase inhibitor-like YbhB/YbcL family protein
MGRFRQSRRSSLPQTASRFIHLPSHFALGLCCALVLPMMLAPFASCSNAALSSQAAQDPAPSEFRISSTAFREGESIPMRFTCKGENASPALSWTEPPNGTRSFALIVEDPDAPGGIWTHWVVYNLPGQLRRMPGNIAKQDQVPGGGLQGLNSFGNTGYGGPCPPPGDAHRYYFRLYALDAMLSLQPGAKRQDVLATAKGHILGETRLMGRFKR